MNIKKLLIVVACALVITEARAATNTLELWSATTTSNEIWKARQQAILTNKPFASMNYFVEVDFAVTSGGAITLTNYAVLVTNRFGGSLATGRLTNNESGFYRISWIASKAGPFTNAIFGYVYTNGVLCNQIGWHYQGTNLLATVAADGVTFLPANSSIDMRVRSQDGSLTCGFVVGGFTIQGL